MSPAPSTLQPLRVVVQSGDEGLRLDQLLARATSLSRRRARLLIAEGAVRRNGRTTRNLSHTVAAADLVEVDVGTDAVARVEPQPQPLSILHEDEWLLVVDKPAGMLSQPVGGRSGDVSADQRLATQLALRDGMRPFLRLVHRLDRLTSGVLLFVRAEQALPAVAAAWAAGEVERLYLAVVEGEPGFERAELDGPIRRDRSHAWRFEVAADGKPARTTVRVLRRSSGLALVSCRLATGRTHQVRVHLAAAGHPVVGDRLYGSRRRPQPPRPLLHAHQIALPHPASGARLLVRCPLPDDFRAALEGAE